MLSWKGYVSYIIHGRKINFHFGMDQNSYSEGLHIIPSLKKIRHGFKLSLELVPDREIEIRALYLEKGLDVCSGCRIFLNGYQSWTEGREYRPDERMGQLSSLFYFLHAGYKLKFLGDGHFYPYSMRKGELHSYTYSYMRNPDGKISFLGSLSEKEGFTIFHYSVRDRKVMIKKDCAGLVIDKSYPAFGIFTSEGDEDNVFDAYFDAMKLEKPKSRPSAGWTSWYNYYTKISNDIILDNLEQFQNKKVPVDFFQIDDGYQTAVGDWLSVKDSFPGGMKHIAREITKAGRKPGIWLAPFIAGQNSALLREHGDWVLKDPKGKPAIAGFNDQWKGYFYALDFYNPLVRDYIRQVFDTALNQWGFELLKLDFLYAACLYPRKDKTRGAIMTEVMDFLRELAGNKILLGCGVPLGAAFGRVDFCRIGCDVGLDWDVWNTSVIQFRERVSTVNSIADTIGRRHLNGRAFWNDPDVVILRDENVRLSESQKNTLFFINSLFGGLLFTSDNINQYQKEVLKKYKTAIPLKESRIICVKTHDSIYHWKPKFTFFNLLSGIKSYSNAYEIEFERDKKHFLALVNLGGKGISVDSLKLGKAVELAPYATKVMDI